MTHNHDILIVGAGPGGLTAALALRRFGMSCHIVERVERDRLCSDVGGGYHIGSSTLAMLDCLDSGKACRQAGVRFESLHVFSDTGRVIRKLPLPGNVDQVTVRRSRLQNALLARWGDAALEPGVTVASVAQDADQVNVRLSTGAEITARLVIGADGVQSQVRQSIFGDGPPRFCGLTCCWGRLRSDEFAPAQFAPHVAFTQLGPGATLAATCVAGEMIWSATWRTASFQRSATSAERKQRLTSRFAGWANPTPQLIAATDPDVIAEVGIWDRDPCPSWSQGRIVLIGDAAHPMTPFLGQGANSAMLDAFVLASFLKRMPHAEAFQTYQNLRKPLVDRYVQTARDYANYTTLDRHWKRTAMIAAMRYIPASWIVRSMLRADVESDISSLLE